MSLQKPSEAEEEYFAKEEARLRLGLKAKYVRSAAEEERCLAVAKKVGTDNAEVGEALVELGFSPEDVSILPLVPMLEVAWADGSMSYKESTLILDTARKRGLDATTPAYQRLKALTEEQPEASFFEGANRIYAELLHGGERAAEKADTLTLMKAVAGVSGGFFGLTSAVSDEEESVMTNLVKELSLSH